MERKKSSVKIWKSPSGNLTVDRPFAYDYEQKQWVPKEAVQVMMDDCDFAAALKLTMFHHSNRACHFYFKDIQSDKQYMMQGTEMEAILFNHTLDQGHICGRWRFFKKGNVLSIGLLEELDELPQTEGDSEQSE